MNHFSFFAFFINVLIALLRERDAIIMPALLHTGTLSRMFCEIWCFRLDFWIGIFNVTFLPESCCWRLPFTFFRRFCDSTWTVIFGRFFDFRDNRSNCFSNSKKQFGKLERGMFGSFAENLIMLSPRLRSPLDIWFFR